MLTAAIDCFQLYHFLLLFIVTTIEICPSECKTGSSGEIECFQDYLTQPTTPLQDISYFEQHLLYRAFIEEDLEIDIYGFCHVWMNWTFSLILRCDCFSQPEENCRTSPPSTVTSKYVSENLIDLFQDQSRRISQLASNDVKTSGLGCQTISVKPLLF